jgi:hypothetical protein
MAARLIAIVFIVSSSEFWLCPCHFSPSGVDIAASFRQSPDTKPAIHLGIVGPS